MTDFVLIASGSFDITEVPQVFGPYTSIEVAQAAAEDFRELHGLPREATAENNEKWTNENWWFGIVPLEQIGWEEKRLSGDSTPGAPGNDAEDRYDESSDSRATIENISKYAGAIQDFAREVKTGDKDFDADGIDLAMGDILSECARLREQDNDSRLAYADAWVKAGGADRISRLAREVLKHSEENNETAYIESAGELANEIVSAKPASDEYMILLDGGYRFYTGGWEDIRSLLLSLPEHFDPQRTIAGSLDPGGMYYETAIARSDVKLVQDLRTGMTP